MSENPQQKYLIRDHQGNVYGPANAALLRDWVAQGRIVAGMFIAERETRHWVEASQHPAVADLLSPHAPRPATSASPAPRAPAAIPQDSPYSLTPKPAPPTPVTIQPDQPRKNWDPVLYPSSAASTQPNIAGLIGFIASLVGLFTSIFACLPVCICGGAPVSALLEVTAIVLGSIALYQMRENPERYHGRGIAMAAVIIGAADLVLLLIAFAVLFAIGTLH